MACIYISGARSVRMRILRIESAADSRATGITPVPERRMGKDYVAYMGHGLDAGCFDAGRLRQFGVRRAARDANRTRQRRSADRPFARDLRRSAKNRQDADEAAVRMVHRAKPRRRADRFPRL